MTVFFVLFRCRITGDEQPEIIRHENWLCCWGESLRPSFDNERSREAG